MTVTIEMKKDVVIGKKCKEHSIAEFSCPINTVRKFEVKNHILLRLDES